MKIYRKLLIASIVVIYLIIIAGAVVRMTGSGMGCPDWPKCFGYLIPPTEAAQLEFQPNHNYETGQVIIKNQELRVVTSNFISTTTYDASNWEQYTKHDYSVFNVYHTYTEYVNRLIGALGGLIVLIMAVYAIRFWKRSKKVVLLSWIAVISMGVQAVIGKIVVDTLLSPVLITIHMVVALLIVGLLLYLYHITLPQERRWTPNKKLANLTWVFIGLTMIQVVLGTQVRQHVDHVVDIVGYDRIGKSITDQANWIFYVHRTFSTILLVFGVWFFSLSQKLNYPQHYFRWLIMSFLVAIFSGVAMNYFNFPFGTQAIHLVIASLILGLQFLLLMQLRGSKSL